MSLVTDQKLLICGYGRSGKDTVAEILQDRLGLKFISSSRFALFRSVWPIVNDLYETPEEAYADRVNHRELWFHAIRAYNLRPGASLAEEMLTEGYNMYVGMRSRQELVASRHLFDAIVWVDARGRVLPEPKESNEICPDDCTVRIRNSGSLEALEALIDRRIAMSPLVKDWSWTEG